MTSNFFELSDGSKLHYEVSLSLPRPTFFIHGNLASNNWWKPTLSELQKQYPSAQSEMIMAEFKGCGKSSAPKSEADVNMHDFASQFCDLIESLNLKEKVCLVGHSTGGLIAALMLEKKPLLFEKALLLDPVGAKGVTFDSSMIQAFEAMKSDKALTATVIGSTIHNNSTNEFFKTHIVEDAFHSVKTVGHWVLKALDALDTTIEIGKITQPVLVLHGEHDALLSKEESKKMAELIPAGHFEEIPGHGHCTNIEDPKLMAQLLSKYFYS